MKLCVLLMFYITTLLAMTTVQRQEVIPNIIIKNGGFENGKAGWTSAGSPTTFAVQSTTVGVGNYALQFDAAADADAAYQSGITLDPGHRGQQMALAFLQSGGDANLSVQVLDQASNILLNQVLEVKAAWGDVVLNFTTGAAATSLTVKIIATADAAVGYFDDFFILPASRVNISRVDLFPTGSASRKWINVADCAFLNNGGTVMTDAQCNAATTTIGSSTGSDDNFQITKTLPAGKYKIAASGNFRATYNTSATTCTFWISDGTNLIGSAFGQTGATSAGDGVSGPSGMVEYTSQAERTFQVISTRNAGDGNCQCNANDTAYSCEISIEPIASDENTLYTGTVDNSFASLKWQAVANCSFTATSGVLTDADCNTPTTTIGTATATADQLQIAKTLPAGKYKIEAKGSFRAAYASSNTSCVFSISDGTTTIGATYGTGTSTADAYFSGFGGEIEYTSEVTKTFQVIGTRVAGGGGCTCDATTSTIDRSCSISIEPVTQSKPQPQILNQVSSTSGGGVKVVSARITNSGTPTITSQDGSWLTSITDSGVGNMTFNLVSGTFSYLMGCFITPSGVRQGVRTLITDNNTVEVDTFVTNSADYADTNFSIFCIGAK